MTKNVLDTVQINFDASSLWLMNIILGLVMFGVALEIAVPDLKKIWNSPKPLLVGVLSQFLLLPLVTFVLVYILKPIPSIALGMFMVAACPGGNISNFISYLAKANTALSVSLTAVATLLAIVMTPLNFHFWSMLYPPSIPLIREIFIDSFEMVELVSLILGLPLIAGLYVHHIAPKLAMKLSRILKTVSLFFFISLVFIALYKNLDIFKNYIFYVFWIVLIHNFLAFATGFSVSKVFGLSKADTRAITIETGIQNSGLGLLLIFTFFKGLGGMALLAAFWGIWHMVSGLLLATCWNFSTLEKRLKI
ncbi:MAG: bile acid:sodium symporter family protein [Maribacter sp.]